MHSKFAFFALVMAATLIARVESFINEVEKPVNFECPKNQVIRSVYSIHDDVAGDRRWRFGCGPTPGNIKPNKCYWTDEHVNDWDQPVAFMCLPNFMIAGIESEFDSDTKDRIMKVRCCTRPRVKTQSCSVTDYLNDWDAPLFYRVAAGKVLTGWFSYHDDYSEDRRHKMIECTLG